MAGNLTAQVRGIARVVTAVANGDLKRKLMLDAKGEIETLADTINEMIDTWQPLPIKCPPKVSWVTAKVPGGWYLERFDDNVNELAAI